MKEGCKKESAEKVSRMESVLVTHMPSICFLSLGLKFDVKRERWMLSKAEAKETKMAETISGGDQACDTTCHVTHTACNNKNQDKKERNKRESF